VGGASHVTDAYRPGAFIHGERDRNRAGVQGYPSDEWELVAAVGCLVNGYLQYVVPLCWGAMPRQRR